MTNALPRWPTVLLITLLLTGFIWLLPFKRSFFLPSLPLLGYGLWLLATQTRRLLTDPATRLLGQFSLAVALPLLLATPFALDPPKTALMALFAGLLWLMGVGAMDLVRRFQLTLWVQYALFAVLLFWCIDGLWQALWGQDLFGFPRSHRLGGYFSHPPKFGWYLGMLSGLLLLPTLSWLRLGPWQTLLFALVLSVIFLANTRAAWLATIMVLLVWFRWQPRAQLSSLKQLSSVRQLLSLKKPLQTWPLLLLCVLTANLYAFDATFAQRIHSSIPGDWSFDTVNTALGQRPLLWQFAWQQIQASPWLGTGVNTFERLSFYATQAGAPIMLFQPHAHQLLLDVWLVSGLPGLLGLGWISLRLIAHWRTAPEASKRRALPLLATLAIIWFPLNTHRDFYASEAMHLTWWLLALGLAALMPAVTSDELSPTGSQPAHPGTKA